MYEQYHAPANTERKETSRQDGHWQKHDICFDKEINRIRILSLLRRSSRLQGPAEGNADALLLSQPVDLQITKAGLARQESLVLLAG
jgi:hypothetical protein